MQLYACLFVLLAAVHLYGSGTTIIGAHALEDCPWGSLACAFQVKNPGEGITIPAFGKLTFYLGDCDLEDSYEQMTTYAKWISEYGNRNRVCGDGQTYGFAWTRPLKSMVSVKWK